MTYRNNDGTNKFEAVFTVRVRFNVNSEQLDTATMGARLIRDRISDFLESDERLNDQNLSQRERDSWSYDSTDTVNVTYDDVRFEAMDHASRDVQQSSIWHDGVTWNTVSHAVSRWNDNWRVIHHSEPELENYRHLDTSYDGAGSRRVVLPTIPAAVLRRIISENRHNVISNVARQHAVEREQELRRHIMSYLDGIFEDGLSTHEQVNSEDPWERYINTRQQPEPF